MSDIRKARCQRCKAFFELPSGLLSGVCQKCTDERAQKIKLLHTLVKENPGITPLSLNQLTGIPINIITKMIAEGLVEKM